MFSTRDPLNRVVTLKSETYNHKIANIYGTNNNGEHGNSHPEISVPDIKSTIEHPSKILIDTSVKIVSDEEVVTKSDTREEYIGLGIDTEKACLKCIKVVVEFDPERKNGEVVTAHLNNHVSKIKTKGGVVYDENE